MICRERRNLDVFTYLLNDDRIQIGRPTVENTLRLHGNAIALAGTVRARKASRHATSDWMAMEKERGISVSTSVMRFDYRGRVLNLLDTPGHADFSEDTYRTLTAVDSVLMVIDAAKGVEPRTIKLLEVCRMRATPVITFINKLDREARDPVELLDEIEAALGIECAPVNWPVGAGRSFRGVYELAADRFLHYQPGHGQRVHEFATSDGLASPAAQAWLGADHADFADAVELVRGASHAQDAAAFLAGKRSPVLFGTALGNFGVRECLDRLVEEAPPPQARNAGERAVAADEPRFSGFVGAIRIADTFTEGESLRFAGIPSFAPELFQRVRARDPLRSKQLAKGLAQLAEEGATQVFFPLASNDVVIGAIGPLQFDVTAYRLAREYRADCVFEPASLHTVRWVSGDAAPLAEFERANRERLARDGGGRLAYLAPTRAALSLAEERWPTIRFAASCEHAAD